MRHAIAALPAITLPLPSRRSTSGGASCDSTLPCASSSISCAVRNRDTSRPVGVTMTSRRSRSSVIRRVSAPPAAGNVTSSPLVHATSSASAVASYAMPRGSAHTARRPRIVPVVSRSTIAPPRRSATWKRPAPSSTTRPGSSPGISVVSTERCVPRSTTTTRSRSGSATMACLPSLATVMVPPLIGTPHEAGGVGDGGVTVPVSVPQAAANRTSQARRFISSLQEKTRAGRRARRRHRRRQDTGRSGSVPRR